MRINETKKGNMSVHEAINVLLWYCQEIKGEALIKRLPFYYCWR